MFRPIFVTYLAISYKNDIYNLNSEQITVNYKELLNWLLPMLSKKYLNGITEDKKEWVTKMLTETRKLLRILLKLKPHQQKIGARACGPASLKIVLDYFEPISRFLRKLGFLMYGLHP
jgi:hypothetical protein